MNSSPTLPTPLGSSPGASSAAMSRPERQPAPGGGPALSERDDVERQRAARSRRFGQLFVAAGLTLVALELTQLGGGHPPARYMGAGIAASSLADAVGLGPRWGIGLSVASLGLFALAVLSAVGVV